MRHPTFSSGLAADIAGLLAAGPRSVFTLADETGAPLHEVGAVLSAAVRAGQVRLLGDPETQSESLAYLVGVVNHGGA